MQHLQRYMLDSERAEHARLYAGQTRRGGNRRAWKRLCARRAALWLRVIRRLHAMRSVKIRVKRDGTVVNGIVKLPTAGRPSLGKFRSAMSKTSVGARDAARSRASRHGGVHVQAHIGATATPYTVG